MRGCAAMEHSPQRVERASTSLPAASDMASLTAWSVSSDRGRRPSVVKQRGIPMGRAQADDR